ncbi:MAG TPA: hypothetical protein VJA23_04595 [Candidatus Nanoarchaeia archaeon]|nr:hypothetical protein [Candidatus Nanoarchaeia archaeon]
MRLAMRKINKFGLILVMILLGVLIISCASKKELVKEQVGEGNKAVEESQAIVPEIAEAAVEESQAVIVPEATYDPELAQLKAKSKEVNNYQYVYKLSIRNFGGNYIPEPYYNIYIKDNLIKKAYLEPQKTVDGRYYSEVYLDTKAQTAVIVCTLKSSLCDKDRGKKYEIRYESEKLKFTPKDLVQDLPESAIKSQDETFDGRSLEVFEMVKEKISKISVSIDKYSGLAIKRTVYDFKDDEEMILEKHTFTNLELNNVKKAEVSLG